MDASLYVTLSVLLLVLWWSQSNRCCYFGKFAAYYVITSVIALIYFPVCFTKPWDVVHSRRVVYVVRHVAKLIGITYELEGRQFLGEDKGALVVSNHQTTLDILGLFNIWETAKKISAIARKEVFYVMPFGLVAWFSGVVFIDRSKPEKAHQTLREITKLVDTNQVKVWMFPEGTRNRHINKTRSLLKFKRGAFKMAIDSQAPILPVVFSPYYFMDHENYYFGRGKIIIKALPPIATKGLTHDDLDKLMERVHSEMETAFQELCERVEVDLPESHPFRLAKLPT